jgi:hypothetical protein
MSTTTSPARAAPCLQGSGERKGGTLIADEVTTLQAHRARICTPDGYRPKRCARCGRAVHVHDYRPRRLVAFEPRGSAHVSPVIDVARYRCPRRECGAIWQVLPAFVARHLWRAWSTVESATLGNAPATHQDVPERTRARWWSRLWSSARLLVQLFATETGSMLESLAQRLGLISTRHELVLAYAAQTGAAPGTRLESVAAIVHRLARGLRLM